MVNEELRLKCFALLALLLAGGLACSSNPDIGKDPSELEGIVREGDSDWAWYSKYVTLQQPQVKMAKSFSGNRMVIFSGVIENGGEKSLDLVEVELILFNFDERVHGEVRVPISPTSHYTKPLEPLSSRAFTLYMDEFPSEWRASNAEMAIHGFRFQPDRD